MKKIVTLLILVFSVSIISAQQPKRDRKAVIEKVKSMRVGFITNALDLTPEESQKFWPIYNQYESEKANLMKESIQTKDAVNSDAEGSAFLTKYFEWKEKELALEKKYAEKFKTVLPVKKVGQLYVTEKKFRQEIMSKIAQKKT
jgi:hypothetical protein